ncbi:MAG: HAMP domain-containing histidine kinase [Dehalococcoidia bacterium]|nr:HAMP domain-containing histidine kinase [Dehalococcoidia bacterium]
MRYQVTTVVIGIVTFVALGAAALFIGLSLSSGDDGRRQRAAEAEFEAFQAALLARADGLRGHAVGLLQQEEVVRFAVTGGSPPSLLTFGRASRGGADYLLVSGPGRALVFENGLMDSIVHGVNDTSPQALALLDGATAGGIFDFAEGPVLAAGAATSPGTERAAVALGLRLDTEALEALAGGGERRVTLTWASDGSEPDGVRVQGGATPGRVAIVGPVALAEANRALVAAVEVPASVLPEAADQGLSRWLIVMLAFGGAGIVAFGVVVRVMAGGIDDVRSGLLAAQETEGNPAVLDSLAGSDEVGRTAAQAAATLRTVRERTVAAIDEARVATARQLLGEHVIRSMHEGVLVERSDTTCIVLNPAATDLLQVEPATVLGVRNGIREVLGGALYQRLRERAHDRDLAQRLEVFSLGGRDLAFDAYEVPEYRSDGHSLLIIIRDVSAVLEVEQLKRDVVSVVSHELRTPLTVVALSIGMLDEPGADQAQLVAAAERNVQRMRELVDDMLDLARLESGQATLDHEAHNPVTLVQEVLQFLRPQAEAKQVTVRDAVDGDLPDVVEVDRKQVQRAVTNLVSNAVKFSPSGSDVWVVLRPGGDWLYIDVADSGPGIPHEEQARIFTRFYRASNTREQATGTGLGLPIVRQIAELHGGRADLLPTEQGSYFRITLPVRAPTQIEG